VFSLVYLEAGDERHCKCYMQIRYLGLQHSLVLTEFKSLCDSYMPVIR